MWYVYVLRCEDESLYTGMTNDLARRMALHRAGKAAKYTRSHPPKTLIMAWQCESETAARRLEYAFKTLARPRKLSLLAAPQQVTEVFPALSAYAYTPLSPASLAVQWSKENAALGSL